MLVSKLRMPKVDYTIPRLFKHNPDCRETKLVRIFGQLREYEGKKSILVVSMSVVEDWNELTHHLLEVTLQHLQATRGPIPGTGFSGGASKIGTPTFGHTMPGGQSQFYQNAGGMRQPSFGGSLVKDEDNLNNAVIH